MVIANNRHMLLVLDSREMTYRIYDIASQVFHSIVGIPVDRRILVNHRMKTVIRNRRTCMRIMTSTYKDNQPQVWIVDMKVKL